MSEKQLPKSVAVCSISQIAEILAGHMPPAASLRPDSRQAAVAMILRQGQSGPVEALFIQRAVCPADPWSGHVAFPGGRRESPDEDLESVARRETREEVGLQLTPKMRIGRLPDVFGGRFGGQGLLISPFVFHHPAPPLLELNPEVASAIWIPLACLAEPNSVKTYCRPVGPAQRRFPSFHYQGYVIWGLTYRMVASFMRLFGVELPSEESMTRLEKGRSE